MILLRNIFRESNFFPFVLGSSFGCGLRGTEIFEKFSGIKITVIDMEDLSENFNILSDNEIINTDKSPSFF